MMRTLRRTLIAAALCISTVAWGQAETYEVGGPLAGLKLPLSKGAFGEEAGYPGCVPELIAQGKDTVDMGNTYREWDRQGQAAEYELYPGAMEHWRAYWFKYCPVRSLFDRQSQLRNWTAPELPGATREHLAVYASPVYWVPRHAPIKDTGKRLSPVPVVRLKPNAPVLTFDLGALPEGMYAVRVIAAVETAQLRPFRRPVFLRMAVNDGLKGEITEYKRRIGYCDEFYSVCEFYFNAPEKRPYRAELRMDAGSEAELLVRNVSLDDVLAGTQRAAIKTGVTVAATPAPKPQPARYTVEDRLARDEALWNYLPPPNHQGSGNSWKQAAYYAIFPDGVTFGAGDKSRSEIEQEFGAWAAPGLINQGRFTENKELWNVFLANKKLNLVYTLDDLRAYKPLPDPYPFKDDGTGLYFADAADPMKGRVLAEVAIEVMNRIRGYPAIASFAAKRWRESGDVEAARDGVVALARYAWLFPSIESATYLCNLSRDPGAYGRNMFDRRREAEAMFLDHYANYLHAPQAYDALFDFIPGNQALADSIGRFIPWVRTPEDVVKLLDVYLVQMTAKRILRYHWHTNPTAIADLAAVLGPSDLTQPWIDWLFARSFIYPLPVAGVQDLMITGDDREGAQYIGSTYYAQGEGASGMADSIEAFVRKGTIPPKYDLTNSLLYPKPLAKCHWQFDIVLAGLEFPRIGDVGGPDKSPGMTMSGLRNAAVMGWRWSPDPRFAWVLAKQVGRKGYSDDDWAEIEKAAAALPRAPWLDNKSRQLYNWFGALEAGVEHNDPALRRCAYVRTGAGIGHQHADSLDLQYAMLGAPMTVDGGQRPGYTQPSDGASRVHNVVEVDGRSIRTQSWVRCISDGEGARFLTATAAPPSGLRLFQRSIALIDTDTTPANSYVFDIFRVSGGKAHAYCFHGPVADAVTTNARDMAPFPPAAQGVEPTPEQAYLGPFRDVPPKAGARTPRHMTNERLAGTAPGILETTWRYSREPGPGSEMQMLGKQLTDAAPRRYTRLHLFDAEGARVFRADAICYQWDYKYICQMVRKDGGEQERESAFVALHEPYLAEPYIAERRPVTIEGNDTDARRAVAIEVKLKSGRTDLLFADGTPDKTRTLRAPFLGADAVQAAGEFAFYSADARGFRLAALTGGTLLKGPQVEIRAARREYTARITAADYFKKTLRTDTPWPAACGGGVFEIIAPERTTSYTSAAVLAEGGAGVVRLTRGADYLRAQVTKVDEKTGVVTALLEPSLGRLPGLDKDFVASNEQQTKFWRADVLEDGAFRLKGAPVAAADFGQENALRLWEYGVGDTVRQSTAVTLRRVEIEGADRAGAPALYELSSNVGVTVLMPGKSVEIGPTWGQMRELKSAATGGKVRFALDAEEFAQGGKLCLRVR
jgi:hypothetical protein